MDRNEILDYCSKEKYMKRLLALVIASLIVGGSLAAQNMMPRNSGVGPAPALQQGEVTKIEGRLELVNGFIAIKSRDKTYYLRGIQHLIGFVDGLKEGAQVKIEGYAVELAVAPEYAHMRVTKLTLGSKEYDVSQRQMMGEMGRSIGSRGDADDDRRGMGGRR